MAEQTLDPIHQFHIDRIVDFHPFGIDASFTNAALFMVIIVLAVSFLMILGTSSRAVVPSRLQSAAEMTYEFVANTVKLSAGQEGMKFFPFVFTLFMFVLFANLIGLVPLCLHRHEPDYRHLRLRAFRDSGRGPLRHLPPRLAFSEPFRAVRRLDLPGPPS